MSSLLRATLPAVTLHAPATLLTRAQADAAISAVRESLSNVNVKVPLVDAYDMLTDPVHNKNASRIMEEAVNSLRGELYVGGHDDPARRFELHQLLMGAGFYARAANVHTTPTDPIRFVSNHYNFDVRRDKAILASVKNVTFGDAKEANNQVVSSLLQTERHLFGQHRLLPVSGRQYLVPGLSLRLVKTEEELKRLLELPPIQQHGNFELLYVADDMRIQPSDGMAVHDNKAVHERWTNAIVRCRPEPEPAIAPPLTQVNEELTSFRLRVLLAPPILSMSERIKETLLNLWVYWFSFWILFWMVDEEVITLVGLIWARYKQMQVLKEEAKKSGGKVYIATSKYC